MDALDRVKGAIGDRRRARQRSLDGRVVAITGGARGIGRTCAEALLAEGCHVAIGDLDVTLAEQTAAQLGGGCSAHAVDVTRRDGFAAFLDAVEAAHGPLDVLVNNAGVMFVGAFAKEDDAITDLMVDVNVKGVLNGCKLALPRMLDRGSGHLVNIASLAGKAAAPHLVTYAGTKHAVVGITDSLRAELRGSGVDVSAILPNAVNTELASGLGASAVDAVEPEDVADALLWVLRTGRAEATVPRYLSTVGAPTLALPTTAREAITRRLGGHRQMLDADPAARADYESRAGRPAR